MLESTTPQNAQPHKAPSQVYGDQIKDRGGFLADEGQTQTAEGLDVSTKQIRKTLLAVAELRVLVTLMDTRLKGISNVRRQIQNGTLKTITFSNLFLLFNPGDTVFREEPTNQAFKVFSICGGLPIDRSKAWENRLACHYNDLYSYNEHDVASPFIIDCYSFAFGGKTYGPVQKTFVLQYFAGEKRISSLPICPEKLHPRGNALRETLVMNGKLFVELVKDGRNFAHRTYQGWGRTYKGEAEEIDSQVIIDFSATFRRFMDWAPKLGLDGATSQDPREMTDCSGVPHYKDEEGICIMCENDAFWPEDQIERLRSTEYLDSVRDDLLTTQRAIDLKEKKLILLPGTVFGFALRSRKWVALNIENIQDLLPPEEAFDDLVIEPEHKLLVQALVKTHDRSAQHFGKSFDEEYHADLVRGKGRGLIILLHGPPGVGKTSTAECVADLTGRPLFQITCGDIGTEPDTVERSLDENFLLAHRWECVLLLDEADVFLQERDRTNLKRNALVSVFLRTLEYYSGILFLTTNREGTLDEAFKSRIHISLHYERPKGKDWLKIWKNNIRRVSKHYPVDEKEILSWAKSKFQELNWNGRQIRNAFQAATALAKFSAQETDFLPSENPLHAPKVRLNVQNFNDVAKASIGFDYYLQSIFGLDRIEDRMLREKVRNDQFSSSPSFSNLRSMHHPQSSLYETPPGVQQHQFPQQQSPRGYTHHHLPVQDRRSSASQHTQQHMQGLGGIHSSGGDGSRRNSSAIADDFWDDDDDEAP